jgi:hypothetical protein
MIQGTNWLLLMKKKKGQKSRASVPLNMIPVNLKGQVIEYKQT